MVTFNINICCQFVTSNLFLHQSILSKQIDIIETIVLSWTCILYFNLSGISCNINHIWILLRKLKRCHNQSSKQRLYVHISSSIISSHSIYEISLDLSRNTSCNIINCHCNLCLIDHHISFLQHYRSYYCNWSKSEQ